MTEGRTSTSKEPPIPSLLYSLAAGTASVGKFVGLIGGVVCSVYWYGSATLQIFALIGGLVFSGICGIIQTLLIEQRDTYSKFPTQEDIVLPVFISNVTYKVAGEDAYEGHLIITSNAIYFFPYCDLIELDKQNRLASGSAVAVAAFEEAAIKDQVSPDIIEGITEQSVDERIEAYIKHLRENRQDSLLAETLPQPMIFRRSRIQNLRLGWTLVFDANFDNHVFSVSNDWVLRGALKSGNYLT